MEIKDILLAAGKTALSTAFPAAAPVILAVANQFLPEGKKLEETDTGETAQQKLESLPPEVQVKVMCEQISLEKVYVQESHSSLREMLKHDANSQHTTRPKIAFQAFQVIGISILFLVAAIAAQIFKGEVNPVDVGPTVLFILGPLTVVVHGYFAILRDERQSLHQLMDGKPRTNGILRTLLPKL